MAESLRSAQLIANAKGRPSWLGRVRLAAVDDQAPIDVHAAPSNKEILMFEILILQVIVAILGTVSMGAADWLYYRGRIRQRVHSLWVSASSTAICLPLLIWISGVFLGFGLMSQVLVGTLGGTMFFWMYRNLRKGDALRQVGCGLVMPRSSGRPGPPASNING